MVRLEAETWTDASIHDVVLAFLHAESHKVRPENMHLLDDFMHDPRKNYERMRVLLCDMRRRLLLGEIPQSTKWYRVESLRKEHLWQLGMINVPSFERDLLIDEYKRHDSELRIPPGAWPTPVLWGHIWNQNRPGALTILEGNHRLMAYMREQDSLELSIPVIVGVTEDLCYWHRPDNVPGPLANDLWKLDEDIPTWPST